MGDECCGGEMKMAAPGPEHKRLEAFEGTFKSEVKMWMGPGDPLTSTGVMTNTMVLNGFFLRQEYKGDPGPGPFPNFAGCGFFGYNQATKKYEGFWIDTASSLMQTETGTVDAAGKVWTMVGEMLDPTSGKKMKKRSVIKLESADRHSMEMYFEMDGQESKGMEIRYRRK